MWKAFQGTLALTLVFSKSAVTAMQYEDQESPEVQMASPWGFFNWKAGQLLDYNALSIMTERMNDLIQLTTNYQDFKETQRRKIKEKLWKPTQQDASQANSGAYDTTIKAEMKN